ncbi:MAG: hypothetical protein ABR981_01790 [Candidatus Micrarchaeaceae archaeon]
MPSLEEARRETEKRLEIVKNLKPKIETFADAAILAGSVAMGKNFSVRKKSDIDLIILIKRENIDYLFESNIFPMTEQRAEAKDLFKSGEIDHFTIIEIINEVEVQFHIWDKESHFRSELLELPNPKVYNIWKNRKSHLSGYDFAGKERTSKIKNLVEYQYGDVYDYPPYFISEGNFVTRQPINNVIMDPTLLFTKDSKLLANIDELWTKLAKRLLEESNGKIDLSKKSLFLAIPGRWNFSKESKIKFENRQREELVKLGIPESQLNIIPQL